MHYVCCLGGLAGKVCFVWSFYCHFNQCAAASAVVDDDNGATYLTASLVHMLFIYTKVYQRWLCYQMSCKPYNGSFFHRIVIALLVFFGQKHFT